MTTSGNGESPAPERAEQWRPWRAYAAQHLWTWQLRMPDAITRPSASQGGEIA
jgi:3-methyladenine DNA glycosylase/8-oxoguanine DNA glycosylase